MSRWIELKARAIAESGRITDLVVDPEGRVSATVDTDNSWRQVTRSAAGVWRCDCEGWTWRGECSHQLAVQLAVEGTQASPPTRGGAMRGNTR